MNYVLQTSMIYYDDEYIEFISLFSIPASTKLLVAQLQ